MSPADLSTSPRQRSFDDLGTPLNDVTFCVIDLETTGGSPVDCAITEIGAVKVRGGMTLGTFQTLINPGCAIPPSITFLTGIGDHTVRRAPRIEAVLPSLLEFVGDAVIVGHNIRFDLSFLRAALERDHRPPLDQPSLDTVALARRLVRDEVPNCKLDTLAERFRLDHRPSHRALDDALATADLLHLLIGRATALGVSGLDDLRALPTLAGSDQLAKLRLTERLPRSPGIYLFRGRRGEVLYVGKATNLRARVRQYFSTDRRRKVGALLRQTERIDHKRCSHELEAAVLESRLLHRLRPPFNRHGTRGRSARYLKLVDGLTTTAAVAIEPMWDRMERLAAEGSFEDAAAARDRLTELVEGLDRRRRLDQLRRVERLVLSEPSGAAIELRRGRLTRVRAAPLDGGLDLAPVWRDVEAVPDDPGDPDGMALRDDVADELLLISRWLDRHATTRRIETVRGPWSSSLGWPATRVEALQALRRAAGTPR